MVDKSSLRSMRRAQDASGTMPLLDHRPNSRPSKKSKAANNPFQPPLKRAQAMLGRRLQLRCLRPPTWWEPIMGFDTNNEKLKEKAQNERCIAQEEVRQDWMRRLRPMPHRSCPRAL
ncbi:hypothetical protein PENSOL_c023G09167 [Penicillium solitum]|uniref:Uncharacterized protein n=1 Tax=Penicillium solitum TaxID=60172 RepID=A0A1V6R0Y3_9EURO|nr:uncharacterized protein PENSOL_c023G09167 [Penicillium solitum]OQD94937.1 hypothetical protein PENSOL_c023G09167 [Penicillium solitum]